MVRGQGVKGQGVRCQGVKDQRVRGLAMARGQGVRGLAVAGQLRLNGNLEFPERHAAIAKFSYRYKKI